MSKIKTSSCKAKGRRLQTWVAEQISNLTNIPCGKDEDIESRPMGQTGPDIRISEKVRKLFNFTVECQNSENWTIPKKIKQCQTFMYPGTDWLVIVSKNRGNPIAILDAEVFFRLLKERPVRRLCR